MLVGLRVVLRNPFSERDELGVGLVLGNIRLEPTHDRRTDAGWVAPRLESKLIVKRHPKLFVLRKLKVRWHDADNGGGFAIDPNCLANDMRVAVEIAFPDFVAQDCHLLGARLVILRREIATENWFHVDDL